MIHLAAADGCVMFVSKCHYTGLANDSFNSVQHQLTRYDLHTGAMVSTRLPKSPWGMTVVELDGRPYSALSFV